MGDADGLRQRRRLQPQVVTDDGQTPEAKDGSSFSGRVFRVTFLMLAVSLIVPLLGAIMFLDSPIDPQPLSFKEPPLLLGVLQPNTKLRKAERLFENQLVGPESIANIGGLLFDVGPKDISAIVRLFGWQSQHCFKRDKYFMTELHVSSKKKFVNNKIYKFCVW